MNTDGTLTRPHARRRRGRSHTLTRRSILPLVFALFAIFAASAQAHTAVATTACSASTGNSVTFNWTNFGTSGNANGGLNTPGWKIVYTPTGGTATTLTGSVSFSGSSDSHTVAIPSHAGTLVASSAWTSSQTRDGNANSYSTNLTIPSCLASTAISTTASPGVQAGGQIHDQAVLSGGRSPTGTITFKLYKSTDTSCSTALSTSTTPVNGNGSYASPVVTEGTAGSYQWIAVYSGDANNAGASDSCGQAAEQVTVSPPPPTPPTTTTTPTTTTPTTTTPTPTSPATLASPSIVTTASPGVPMGGRIHDQAVLSGGNAPTGTITFRLYTSSDITCSTALSTSTTPVNGNGSYASPVMTEGTAGTYQWTASYSGDANNAAVADSCNQAPEQVTVAAHAVKAACFASPVRLSGVIGRVRNTFSAHLTSLGVKSVTFYLDGRKLETMTKPRHGRFSITIDARALSYGAHRLLAKATSKNHNCARASRSGTFVHVKAAATIPVFTG